MRFWREDMAADQTGNVSGGVTIFEPATREHVSAMTLDQIPITAIAPASDCRTFALG
jgi:hypothetical protein